MKTMRRKGKATDLRNQTFRSNSRKIAYKFFLKEIAPKTPNIDATAVKFEPITTEAIEECLLWEGPAIYPWDDIPDWKRNDAKGLQIRNPIARGAYEPKKAKGKVTSGCGTTLRSTPTGWKYVSQSTKVY
ncbi:hypothetical protein [Pseudomonas sp. BW7P1]|uniref:hypothetical protein n=1 Tax=Pseudomonas TaxID=286 RepID=UPI0021ADEC1C|nr:hypothetical protein [Pseudomonas sp. BW7P1]UWI61813.1 hypothetical protein NWV16_27690 [Pseudomonas sp. BW7P1]